MKRLLRPLLLIGLAAAFIALSAALMVPLSDSALADSGTPTPSPTPTARISGPDRFAPVIVNYTRFEWWLIEYEDNDPVCTIIAEYEGLPTYDEVYWDCGETIYNDWIAKSKPCESLDPSLCKGYYLQFISSTPARKEVPVKLPAPAVWITVEGCDNLISGCPNPPTLVLTGEDPLPNEDVIGIEGLLEGDPFSCDGSRCEFSLNATDPEGVDMEFWARSSYGDTSERFDARVRVYAAGEGRDLTWYVDVISSQWAGKSTASCSDTWGIFPPTIGIPNWLITPETSDHLASDIPYTYLAGNLIKQGAVDVSMCLDGGLLPDGAANPCGMDVARPAVTEWQNRFDSLIFNVATDTGVPAQLLKNMFSRESQFWPGVVGSGKDVGLGQLTENGADTTLLWNMEFYKQFCPLVLSERTCRKSYAQLKPSQQAMLRGALVRSVDATCEDCPLRIDLSEADFSVGVFAQTLLANCDQAAKVVTNATNKTPVESSIQYEDMWRFTLVNYNAGPGCLYDAVKQTFNRRAPLDWENLSFSLGSVCPDTVQYVNDISQ
jgi:hypothetical protein